MIEHENSPQSMQPGSLVYSLHEQPFSVPMAIRRELPINHSIFQMQQEQPKDYGTHKKRPQDHQSSMLQPLLMNQAIIKMLLAQKMISLLVVASIVLSIYQVYTHQEEHFYILLLNMALTFIFVILLICQTCYYKQHMTSLKAQDPLVVLKFIFKCILILLSPTPWTASFNNFLHIFTLLRLFFPLMYAIRSSMYYSPRAARILNVYGIKPMQALQFSWKALLDSVPFYLMLLAYLGVVLFYSHCLYLTTQESAFIDCFQLVIVTLPTVGFEDYTVVWQVSRVVVLCIQITGAVFNAFLTLSMVRAFVMSSGQANSYLLMEKIKTAENIQKLSSAFIAEQVCSKGLPKQRESVSSYRQTMKELRSRYNSLQLSDQESQFNEFREGLEQLKLKMLQVRNMTAVLVNRFYKERRKAEKKMKETKMVKVQ